MTQDPTNDDLRAQVEALIAWWQPVLGLSHYRVMAEIFSEGHRGESETDGVYPSLVIRISANLNDSKWADHETLESLVLHELLHVVTRDARCGVWNDLKLMPKADRKGAWKRWSDHEERFVETAARALEAVAKADRSGEPPSVGGVVESKGKAA